jgi:hypothetical protein
VAILAVRGLPGRVATIREAGRKPRVATWAPVGRGFSLLLAIAMIDSATGMGFLTFLPFLLKIKGADLPIIGIALTVIFAGGAAGKLACGWLGARLGVVRATFITEGLTAAGILALLPSPLTAGLAVLPVIGMGLNGTSSVLCGTVFELVAPARRQRAILGRTLVFLVWIGLIRGHFYVLEVRGRKTGRTISLPVDPLDLDGQRYLVCARGNSNWVRNARTAGEVTLVRAMPAVATLRASFHPTCVHRFSRPTSTASPARSSASFRSRRDRRWNHSTTWRRVTTRPAVWQRRRDVWGHPWRPGMPHGSGPRSPAAWPHARLRSATARRDSHIR